MAVYAALFYIILGRQLQINNRPPQYKYDSDNLAAIPLESLLSAVYLQRTLNVQTVLQILYSTES